MARANGIRLAIISTPRAGNNWLQQLLSQAYELPRLSPVNLSNVHWDNLPAECVIILHWPRDPVLMHRLREQRFRTLSIARHPLDVLISILQFTFREFTDGWLEGKAGNERAILGAMPRSSAFLDYACGSRARVLLDVSRDWWQDDECVRIRYEDLAANPLVELHRLTKGLGLVPRRPLEEAIAASSLSDLRKRHPERAHHFWQGKPGLWRTLLTVREAERIAQAQAEYFSYLKYSCDADPALTGESADANWRHLLGIDDTSEVSPGALQSALFDVKRELDHTRNRLAEFESLGPTALKLAKHFKGWATRFPRLTRLLKRFRAVARRER